MKFQAVLKILTLGLALSIGVRYGAILLGEHRQDTLTAEICSLVSLPLETGLLRDTHEGLENALKNRGESNVCVSVTDNGRSYSPNCTLAGASYRTVMCKAQANSGVRAAVSFESRRVFGLDLLNFWAAITAVILALTIILNIFAKNIVEIYSAEVKSLLFDRTLVEKDQSPLRRIARWTMNKVGISKNLFEQATLFRSQLREFEKKIESEASLRTRLEQEAISSHAYVEKVKQIRHDIRSPFSSLQAIYERLKESDVATTHALATAIRRIQLLIDDLNQVDHVRETPKLVVAEVAAEEIGLMMANKYREAKSATLTVEFRQEALSPISVGEKEFHGALENLLENSLEAISVGGHTKLMVYRDSGYCKISVEDDGCGISPKNLDKLFTRGGTFDKINGKGLGLYHTKNNVEAWGGTIECTPKSRGVRFTISIPLMQTGVVFSGLPASDQALKVIDDDQAVSRALGQIGFKIIETADTFEDGKAVLAAGTSDDFSIIVDQRLGRDKLGTDLIAEQPGRKKIFLCTNDFDDLGVMKLARDIGIKIIPKPLCFFGQFRADMAAKVVT